MKFSKTLFFFSLYILTSSFTAYKIVFKTDRGKSHDIVQKEFTEQDHFPINFNIIRNPLDLIFLANLNEIPKDPKCINGKMIYNKCQCTQGWAGLNCSIHIHEVSNQSIQLLFHEFQYFLVHKNIEYINVNWKANRVFSINEETGQQIEEIFQGSSFIGNQENQTHIYKVIGSIGQPIFFGVSSSTLQNNLFLFLIMPAIVGVIFYMFEKIKSKAMLRNRLKVLDKSIQNNQDCSICLMNQPTNLKIVLECGHIFHKPCLADWLNTNETCPYCRYNLFQNMTSTS